MLILGLEPLHGSDGFDCGGGGDFMGVYAKGHHDLDAFAEVAREYVEEEMGWSAPVHLDPPRHEMWVNVPIVEAIRIDDPSFADEWALDHPDASDDPSCYQFWLLEEALTAGVRIDEATAYPVTIARYDR